MSIEFGFLGHEILPIEEDVKEAQNTEDKACLETTAYLSVSSRVLPCSAKSSTCYSFEENPKENGTASPQIQRSLGPEPRRSPDAFVGDYVGSKKSNRSERFVALFG